MEQHPPEGGFGWPENGINPIIMSWRNSYNKENLIGDVPSVDVFKEMVTGFVVPGTCMPYNPEKRIVHTMEVVDLSVCINFFYIDRESKFSDKKGGLMKCGKLSGYDEIYEEVDADHRVSVTVSFSGDPTKRYSLQTLVATRREPNFVSENGDFNFALSVWGVCDPGTMMMISSRYKEDFVSSGAFMLQAKITTKNTTNRKYLHRGREKVPFIEKANKRRTAKTTGVFYDGE